MCVCVFPLQPFSQRLQVVDVDACKAQHAVEMGMETHAAAAESYAP